MKKRIYVSKGECKMIKLEGINALIYDGDVTCVRTADIYITDDKISRIDFTDEDNSAKEALTADYTIAGKDKLVIPGLINAHTHSYMSMYRNMADDVPFTKWLFDTVTPLEDAMLPEEAYYGTQLGIVEMLQSGVTSFTDMYICRDMTPRAVSESGMRACMTRGLVGSDRRDEGGLRRLNEALGEYEQWNDGNRLNFMLAPHAPYTCGPDFLAFVADKAKELGLGLNIHLAEGQTEIRNLRKQYNMTPIEYADAAGVFDVNCIAAHCVYLSDNDYAILRDKGVNVAANPVSNMKLANGFSNVPRMLEEGVHVCIGTDGAASNNTLNMFREMAFEAMVHKGLRLDAIAIPADKILRMATLGGARAIGKEGILGAIREGYKADLAILDLKCPQLMPRNNLVSALVYSCNGSEVETVIVDGRILMEKREFKTVDIERVYYEITKIGERYARIIKEKEEQA